MKQHCVCVCIYIYIYAHTYVCVCVCVSVCRVSCSGIACTMRFLGSLFVCNPWCSSVLRHIPIV